jgi:ribosomal-protein-alanine N-acetyltransferase
MNLPDLKTSRLRLVAMTPAMLEADAARDGSLSTFLSAKLTEEWPPFEWEAHVIEMIFAHATQVPSRLGWHRYVLISEGALSGTLIGCVGGFPKEDGTVEIGYSTLPEFQRRGYGSEAAGALIDWLLRQQGIQAVTAQAYSNAVESIKVMERCGMVFTGEGDEPGTVRFRRER